MLLSIFYALNIVFFCFGLLGIKRSDPRELFTLTVKQILCFIPLLAGEYLYLSLNLAPIVGNLIFFSEIIFILLWFSLARRLQQLSQLSVNGFRNYVLSELIVGGLILSAAWYGLTFFPTYLSLEDILSIPRHGIVYISTIGILVIVLYNSWKMEAFWRATAKSERWRCRFFVVGSFLICGALAWNCSYRLTFMVIYPDHMMLLAALIFSGWLMMCHDVINYNLLNQKITISRKVIYSFVFPTLLAFYFLIFGVVSFVMGTFGLQMFFVLKWTIFALGIVGVVLFGMSGKLRRRGHFFISTHFLSNKYEFRDEWLALSENLQGALNENDVVEALRKVLMESLYTVEIFIWIGDPAKGQVYQLVSWDKNFTDNGNKYIISAEDPVIKYLTEHAYFYVGEKEKSQQWLELRKQKQELLKSLKLQILTPISIHDHIAGIIGLGAEYTGGKYSYDDFDLLSAIGTQTASTLLAIRMSEELAKTREQQAWNRLSAFVLHDIKNAATMLSLLQNNAPEHIHEPEFQQDMLELVDDTLKRMKRVEKRLGSLKEDITPNLEPVDLNQLIKNRLDRTRKKMPNVHIEVISSGNPIISADAEHIHSVLENVLINASQAQDNKGKITIQTTEDTDSKTVCIKITDSGPGIDKHLLPDGLFEPFKTTKEGGSGIGLWQVKKLLNNMGAIIMATNIPDRGAEFTITFPCKPRGK